MPSRAREVPVVSREARVASEVASEGGSEAARLPCHGRNVSECYLLSLAPENVREYVSGRDVSYL